jgi:hypothetical protein
MFIFDGGNWSSAVNSSTEWMNDLWGRADTVYGVGDNGGIGRAELHFFFAMEPHPAGYHRWASGNKIYSFVWDDKCS